MKKKRVFIMGGDRGGWALDTEARLARESLEQIPSVQLVNSLSESDIVHTVWPEQLLEDPACAPVLRSKRPIVASFSNDPRSLFARVPGLFSLARQWHCVAQSTKAKLELERLALPSVHQVNYAADFSKFHYQGRDLARIQALRNKFNLPENEYLISSFQRDTEGADLSRMKLQKGPDIFCAILAEVQQRLGSGSFRVLLGGPRRHWIRKELQRRGIPFLFIGKESTGDDYPWQSLPLEQIVELLTLSDLNLVSSRWEGAPRVLMECAALGIPVLSPHEGIAGDLLEADSLFQSLPEAVEKIVSDIQGRTLVTTLLPQSIRVEKNHSVEFIRGQWEKIYGNIDSGPRLPQNNWIDFFSETAVHHPHLHRWVRRLKLKREHLEVVLLPSRDWVIAVNGNIPPKAERALVAQWIDAQAWDEGAERVRAYCEEMAAATIFASFSVWERAMKEGWIPRNPTVMLALPGSTPSPFQAEVISDGPLLCYTGKGQEADLRLAQLLQVELGDLMAIEPFHEDRLSCAGLFLTCAEDTKFVVQAVVKKIPVVFRHSEAIHELTGFGGLSFFDQNKVGSAVKIAWQFRNALRACLYFPNAAEREEQWKKIKSLKKRAIL